ncbi:MULTISPECIES: hypothetical protein [unclassified Enterococcus]|uniref:hypothetical protein n=1 Tax=unclassified Enterococcus TaxID=2608891 RepID=UPI001F1509EB|nr:MULTISPECIES: hypothetical protein [unclassified Enterococcus]
MMHHGNLFLLKAEKESSEEVALARRLYEDVKTYRIHQELPKRKAPFDKDEKVIIAKEGKIRQVWITNGKEVIEIEKTTETDRIHTD